MTNKPIHVNQIGYRPSDSKKFVMPSETSGVFDIVRETGSVAYSGQMDGPLADEMSGETVVMGDFSKLTEPGRYYVQIPGEGRSPLFSISTNVYGELSDALLKSFYFQRCGMELEERFAGDWKHKACHLGHGKVYDVPEQKLPSAGGWHDAGDYGKYTVPAAKAIADLLLAYELFPDAFHDRLEIPESGNGVADVLDEVRYELEWMFLMQRFVDGAVFHKLTTRRFPGLHVMPEDDDAELVFSPVSVTATGTFAASMAMAARIYESIESDFARKCLVAAEKAFEWLVTNREDRGFKNPVEIKTGEYGDPTTVDEKYWAAAELLRTTKDAKYQAYLADLLEGDTFPLYELGWADVGGYGTLAYILSDDQHVNPETVNRLKNGWVEYADVLVGRGKTDGYFVSLTEEDYIWGSMMVLMNNAMHLIVAANITGKIDYLLAAEDHWHYLLGLNPLGQCYVSGFGSKPIVAPHHRPSVGDGVEAPVPGMVAGGPNKNLQDAMAKQALQGQPPAKCFIDHEDSYSTNEMTIYWNSPAVFVAAGLSNKFE